MDIDKLIGIIIFALWNGSSNVTSVWSDVQSIKDSTTKIEEQVDMNDEAQKIINSCLQNNEDIKNTKEKEIQFYKEKIDWYEEKLKEKDETIEYLTQLLNQSNKVE